MAGASHRALWPRVLKAAKGVRIAPAPSLDDTAGSLNYKAMGWLAALLAAWNGDPGFNLAKARAKALGFLHEQQEVGHLAIRGPNGIANEQGCPDPHWKFNALPVAAAWRKALELGDSEFAEACEGWWSAELYLAGVFSYAGITLEPGGRVKNEKKQALSEPRDVALAVALRGVKPPGRNRGPKWWSGDDGITPSILVEILRDHPEIRGRVLSFDTPKLLLPIHKVNLPDGGYLAWIDDTEDARHQLGKDALSWVKNGPGGIELGYDWRELPPLPDGAEDRVYGGA